jgi:hypothetical protein
MIRPGISRDIYRTKCRYGGRCEQRAIALTNPSFIPHPAAAEDLRGIGRLIRQICLLREQADLAQAARLQENELAAAVRELHVRRGSDALPESELQAMFTREEHRVAEAVLLSELLAPRLVSKLPVSTRPAPSATAQPAVAVPSSRPDHPGSPAIPDLLDAMLAAERNSRRQPATVKPES